MSSAKLELETMEESKTPHFGESTNSRQPHNWMRRYLVPPENRMLLLSLLISLVVISVAGLSIFSIIYSRTLWDSEAQNKQTIDGLEAIIKSYTEKQDAMWSRHEQEATEEDRCNAGWVPYKHEKCFKVVDILVAKYEADTRCLVELNMTQQGESKLSPLLTIGGQDEATFLNQLIFKKAGVLDNVWLGGRRKSPSPVDHLPSAQFEWSDHSGIGFPMEFTNWQPGSPSTSLENSCVEMIPIGTRAGKAWEGNVSGIWLDVSCLKRNLVVCQSRQNQPMVSLKTVFAEFRSEMDKRFQKVEANLVPFGFIYAQLPAQANASILWPEFRWKDVTSLYAGLFFRAEGNGSAEFGFSQSAATPIINQVEHDDRKSVPKSSLELPSSGWSDYVISGHAYSSTSNARGMRFHVIGEETRPRNTAIRFWMRI